MWMQKYSRFLQGYQSHRKLFQFDCKLSEESLSNCNTKENFEEFLARVKSTNENLDKRMIDRIIRLMPSRM